MNDKEQTISNLRKLKSFHNGSYGADIDRAIKALEQEPKSEWQHDHEILKAYSDGASAVLDKIKAEIDEQYDRVHPYDISCAEGLEMALNIIDKYREPTGTEEG